jgi:hypothetical protein
MTILQENGLSFADVEANMGVKDLGLRLTVAGKDVVVRYKAENFWTGERETLDGEFLARRLGPRSALLYDIRSTGS